MLIVYLRYHLVPNYSAAYGAIDENAYLTAFC
jgi:hypothetical protein